MNLQIPAEPIKRALCQAWEATESLPRIPLELVAALVRNKYGRDDWNLKF